MPPLDMITPANNIATAKVLIYGVSQTRKTWWAAKAAEAGFNVIFLDGDGNWQTLMNIDAKAKHRLHLITAKDLGDDTNYSPFVSAVIKADRTVYWNDEARTFSYSRNINSPSYSINLSYSGPRDVLVIDSITALAQRTIAYFAAKQGIDLLDSDKLDRAIYGQAALCFTAIGQYIKGLPCHVIAIGHQDDYEKKKISRDGNGKQKEEVLWTRIQYITTSKTQSQAFSKYFSDIIWAKRIGTELKLDTRADQYREGGSRNSPGGTYSWDEYQFIDLIRSSGMAIPDGSPSDACLWLPPGTEEPKRTGPMSIIRKAEAGTSPSAPAPVLKADQPKHSIFASIGAKK